MTARSRPTFGSRRWRFRMLRRVRALPFHWRVTMGVFFLLGGALWFLPVVGIWMLPLGIVVLAFDVPIVRRALRRWSQSRTRARKAAAKAAGG
jgi:hypothetical protein